ncbi:MAG: FAD-binding oxidoreductase [Woeseiaceae bacterium]|nr:FAD-binding oxidoreductase [Woeseiaceae bacterium]
MNRRKFLASSVAAGVASALPASQIVAAVEALTAVQSDVEAITGAGQKISLERAAVDELSKSLRGNLLLPDNDGYDAARRVLNASIDKYPALVIQPNGATDIRHAVNFARDKNLLLAVKCGGHSWAGKSTCNGGMQIDLSTLRHVRIDPEARRAYVAGGSLLGEMDRESMEFGLVTTAGTVSHTGVGGLTLGGGFGRVARRFGLALDNVKGVNVVTADGNLLRADADRNPELYWGVRGGGGNFGIVTSFEFELHPMDRKVLAGELFFPVERARDVLNLYAEQISSAPDDLYCDAMIMSPPGGAPAIAGFSLCYSGPAARAGEVLAPFRKLGKPMVDTIGVKDYVEVQKSFDNSDPRSVGEYMKTGFINDLPGDLVDKVIDGFEGDPGRSTMLYFQHSGGAIGKVDADATAFAHRKSLASMFIFISWPLDTQSDDDIAYMRKYWSTLEKFTDGWYTNEVSAESQRAISSNYQGNFERLLALKKQYDPGNLFRLNANIDPKV